MIIKVRAIHAEEKEVRHHAILDAAERLLIAHRQRIANVDEVAAEAGLAKGTVYLYFPSKEELLLALHDRNSERFFTSLLELLTAGAPVTFDRLFQVVRRDMVDAPGFLPLAALCFGLMEKSVPIDAAAAHKLRTAERLQTAGTCLERQFPQLAEGQGVALLIHSYALIIGLWQMLHPSPVNKALADAANFAILHRDYTAELEGGLRALWDGHLSGATPL